MRRDKRVALHPLAFLDAVVETQGISAEQPNEHYEDHAGKRLFRLIDGPRWREAVCRRVFAVLGLVLILATLAITAHRSRRSGPSGSRCLRSEPAGRAS
jgi:hypothetical protein